LQEVVEVAVDRWMAAAGVVDIEQAQGHLAQIHLRNLF
jgi:hypothetical protein